MTYLREIERQYMVEKLNEKDIKCLTCNKAPTEKIGDVLWCTKCEYGRSIFPFDPDVYDVEYVKEYAKRLNSKMSAQLTQFRLNFVGKYVEPNYNHTILDYGCGAGIFAAAASDSWTAMGYDINKAYVRLWDDQRDRGRQGFEEKSGVSLTNTPPTDDKIHILTCWDSLEHITDPKGLIHFYEPAYLFVTIPVVTKAKLEKSRHYKPSEHLHYFGLRGVIRFFTYLGYKLLEKTDTETQLGREDIHSYAFVKVV